MARRKEARFTTLFLQDGTGGTGAVNDGTLVATDTSMDVDTLVMNDSVTIVPANARFVTAGIATVRSITATNNSQEWNLTNGSASAGTFTLTLNSEETAGIAFDATKAAVLSALEALSSVAVGDVIVGGTDAGPWTIQLAGALKNISTNTLTYDGTGLTGGPGVLSVLQTGLVTWNVTFTPALVVGSIPADDDVITWLPQRVALVPEGDGTANWTESQDPQMRTSRGVLDGVTAGTEVPLQFNTSMILDFFRASSGSPLQPYEVFNQLGEAKDWLTSAGVRPGGSFCEPFAIDIVLEDRPPCGSAEAEVTIIRSFNFVDLSPSIEDSQIEISGLSPTTRPDNQRVANNDDALGIIQ